MKWLYGKRSDIVHGNIKGSDQQEKESVVSDFEENMRISLKYIELFKTGNYRCVCFIFLDVFSLRYVGSSCDRARCWLGRMVFHLKTPSIYRSNLDVSIGTPTTASTPNDGRI